MFGAPPSCRARPCPGRNDLFAEVHYLTDAACTARHDGLIDNKHMRGSIMGKYFIGWLLGIPAVVLVILYFIFG